MTNTDALIDRLRAETAWTQQRPYWHLTNPDGNEAADLITSQQSRIAELEAALEPFVHAYARLQETPDHPETPMWTFGVGPLRRAYTALKEPKL